MYVGNMTASNRVRVVMHWRVNSFRVSSWYSPGDGELLFEGAVCECDAWERHQLQPPEERTCPHIRQVKAYIATVGEMGHAEDQIVEDSIEHREVARSAGAGCAGGGGV